MSKNPNKFPEKRLTAVGGSEQSGCSAAAHWSPTSQRADCWICVSWPNGDMTLINLTTYTHTHKPSFSLGFVVDRIKDQVQHNKRLEFCLHRRKGRKKTQNKTQGFI